MRLNRSNRLLKMATVATLLACAITIVADAARSDESRSRREIAPSYTDQYSVISQYNIFARDRYHARPHETTGPTTAATRPAEESYILTGIVLEDDGFHAYVENPDEHQFWRLSPGDAVARGKVGAIDIDAFDYVRGDQHTWIEVGSDLTGKSASIASLDSSTTEASTEPSGPPIDPNDPNLTIEQRMKLRRQQELHK